jgi:hypothetical protein
MKVAGTLAYYDTTTFEIVKKNNFTHLRRKNSFKKRVDQNKSNLLLKIILYNT